MKDNMYFIYIVILFLLLKSAAAEVDSTESCLLTKLDNVNATSKALNGMKQLCQCFTISGSKDLCSSIKDVPSNVVLYTNLKDFCKSFEVLINAVIIEHDSCGSIKHCYTKDCGGADVNSTAIVNPITDASTKNITDTRSDVISDSKDHEFNSTSSVKDTGTATESIKDCHNTTKDCGSASVNSTGEVSPETDASIKNGTDTKTEIISDSKDHEIDSTSTVKNTSSVTESIKNCSNTTKDCGSADVNSTAVINSITDASSKNITDTKSDIIPGSKYHDANSTRSIENTTAKSDDYKMKTVLNTTGKIITDTNSTALNLDHLSNVSSVTNGTDPDIGIVSDDDHHTIIKNDTDIKSDVDNFGKEGNTTSDKYVVDSNSTLVAKSENKTNDKYIDGSKSGKVISDEDHKVNNTTEKSVEITKDVTTVKADSAVIATTEKFDDSDRSAYGKDAMTSKENRYHLHTVLWSVFLAFFAGILVAVAVKMLHSRYRKRSYVLPPEQNMQM